MEPGPDFENSESNNTIFDINQGNVSGSLHDIYYQIKVGNTIIPVMISSLGNSVSNLNYDSEAKSIILVISSLNAKADTLIIDIPRIILDSKINGNDKNFTVTVDDQPARFLELKNSIEEKPISHSMTDNISAIQYSNNTESRKLMVEFEQNTKIIKISGTDTIISTNQAEDDDTRNTMILRENEDVINMLFPIISLIAVLSGILLYFYLRKNKIYLMKKFKSK